MDEPPALDFQPCVGLVVTYDPIRRKGFLAITEWKKRAHFVLQMVPEPLYAEIIQASRPLDDIRKGRLPDEAFQPTMAAIKNLIKGKRFRLLAALLPDGKVKVNRRSFELVEDDSTTG